MNRTRYLPPGSMRRQRRLGRLEGSVGTLVLVLAVGAALVAATPVELYRPAPATVQPHMEGQPGADANVTIAPCVGAGKDCTDADPNGTVTLLPRTGPQPKPMPHAQHEARHVPEPGTAALIAAGIAGLIWRTKT